MMIKDVLCFSVKVGVVKQRCLAISLRPGGFRELREACRNHFHLSGTCRCPWSRIIGDSQKPLGGTFSSVYSVFEQPEKLIVDATAISM